MGNQMYYKHASRFTSRDHSSFVKSRIPVDRNLGPESSNIFQITHHIFPFYRLLSDFSVWIVMPRSLSSGEVT